MKGRLRSLKWWNWNRNCHDQLSTGKKVTTQQWPATPCHTKLHNNGWLLHATPNYTNQLIACNIVLLNKLIYFQTEKKFPVTRSPSLRSQESDICPYSKSDQSFFRTPTESLKINFNIILPSTTMSSEWSLSYRFPHQYVWILPLPLTRYMPRPSHSSLFNHPIYIWWGVQIIKLLLM